MYYAVVAILIGAGLSAAWTIHVLNTRNRLQMLDFGTMLMPPCAFLLVSMARPELHVGYAMLIWPVVIAAFAMYAMPLKVIALNLGATPKYISAALFWVSVSAAVVLGLSVPPWHD